MIQYPIILVPKSIQHVKTAQPPLPSTPQKPQPLIQPKPIAFDTIAIKSLIIVGVSLITAVTFPPTIVFIIFMVSVTLQIVLIKLVYNARQQKYYNNIQEYQKRLLHYENEMKAYRIEVSRTLKPENIETYRRKLLLDILRNTTSNREINNRAREGRFEKQFGKELCRCFGDKINTNLTLNIPNYEYPYTPDFAYFDRSLNLFIDIEIDEPYTDEKSIHYNGADDERNNFFLACNWIIIRFAEEQVATSPLSCCREIAKVIDELLGIDINLRKFAGIFDLTIIPQWTESQSLEMAASNHRDTYKHYLFQPSTKKHPSRKAVKEDQQEFLVWEYDGFIWSHVRYASKPFSSDLIANKNICILPRGQSPKQPIEENLEIQEDVADLYVDNNNLNYYENEYYEHIDYLMHDFFTEQEDWEQSP